VNRVRVTEQSLSPGDILEFGPGGPSAQLVGMDDVGLTPTLDVSSRYTTARLFNAARARTEQQETGSGRMQRSLTTTREFMAMAYRQSSKRTRRATVALVAVVFLAFGAFVVWQQRGRAELRRALDEFAAALESERGSRTLLERSLATVQTRYDSLLAEVEQSRERLEESQQVSARNSRFVEDLTRTYSGGVALIVSSYGFREPSGTELLRYQVDSEGRPIPRMLPDGRMIPRLVFGGPGPPLTRQGSATGFLIDSTGWLLTNRHVARPWDFDEDMDFLRASGLDAQPTFLELRAYFPPGDQSTRLVVERTSDVVDIAVLRALDPDFQAPALPLAAEDARVPPGEQIVFMGYPTGVHNLLYRISSAERSEILQASGEDPVDLARELARRNLIQPLVITGSVSDTTGTEVIHTAGATGGGSGGPLFGSDQVVVGIHYAAVRSPIQGDPFQTQRGVRIGFAWEVLPAVLQARLAKANRVERP
jgi:S1-C subfamily serine protease